MFIFQFLGISCCKNNSMVTVPVCDLHPCESWPSSLHIYFFHTGASFLIRLLYIKHLLFSLSGCGVMLDPLLLYQFQGLHVFHGLPVGELSSLLSPPLENL